MGDDSITNFWRDWRDLRWITVKPLSWPRSKWKDILGHNLRKDNVNFGYVEFVELFLNTMKFSLTDSCVEVWRFSNFCGTTSVPIIRVCWWIGSIETDDSTLEDVDGVGFRNVGKFLHLHAAVYPRKCRILSLRKLQDLHFVIYKKLITTEKRHRLKEEAPEHFWIRLINRLVNNKYSVLKGVNRCKNEISTCTWLWNYLKIRVHSKHGRYPPEERAIGIH